MSSSLRERRLVITGERSHRPGSRVRRRARRSSPCAPSATQTGGRSRCGSAWARLPPTVATLRTRTLAASSSPAGSPAGCAPMSARMLQLGESRHGADAEGAAIGAQRMPVKRPSRRRRLTSRCGLIDLRLHHQHQRGATTDGAHGRILMIEQTKSLFERPRLKNFETHHRLFYPPPATGTSCRRVAHPVKRRSINANTT